MNEVLIACSFPSEVADRFAEAFDLRWHDPSTKIGEQCDGCNAVIFSVETRMDAEVVASLPLSVTALATYSVGTDHIDLPAVAARGLNLLNTPDVLSASVAETAVLLALGAFRRATESIELIRSGSWTGWTPSQLIGRELTGKRAGIFGMGRIGREIASRLSGLGMTIGYCNRRRLAPELEKGAEHFASVDQLLSASDLLVLASPATPETIGFLDAPRIERMKTSAVVVNIARGSLVNDDDLIAALTTGRLRAAGLDVFNNEPHLDPRYLELPNVFLLPHIGSSTIEARTAMGDAIIGGLKTLAVGGQPSNLVSL